MGTSYRTIIRTVALCTVLAIIFLSLPQLCTGHNHGQDENPAYKYSKQANEPEKTHSHHHDHDHHHHKHDESEPLKKGSDDWSIWIHSLGSTALISAAPFFILYFIPLDNTALMQPRLKVLLAFASGGLLGDAFLHLIPHATQPHSHHDHDHSHTQHHNTDSHNHDHDMAIGLYVLTGIVTFLVVEKVVRLLRGNSDNGHGHSHQHSHVQQASKEKKTEKIDKKTKNDKNDKVEKKKKNQKNKDQISSIKISGYLNLAADFTHNFTDGLAIGASYLAGTSVGLLTTVTILLHEVPHEIGDFAILIKSGCSRRKAMALQLLTALGAIAGTVIALLGTNGESSPWVLPFTAGGFIYIATVSVLPELLEESTKLGQSIKEISALLTGVGLMVLIAKLE